MFDTYNDVLNQMTASQDEVQSTDMSDESNKLIMSAAKKQFRKNLIDYLVIPRGLQHEPAYQYLFDKVEKDIDKKIDFPTAISMAVKSASALIDKDFEYVINDANDDSSTGDEESGEDMVVA